jgi:hypothetical protein
MVIDGSRALVVGSYITPKSGQHQGRLGPWAGLVRRLGIDPEGKPMKWLFVLYGLAWLAIVVAFLLEAPWAWAAMVIAAAASLWYLMIGTVTSLLVLVLLFLPAVRT